jgi:hypothetical protein
MVEADERRQVGRGGQLRVEPVERLVGQQPIVAAGNARVAHREQGATDPVRPVDRRPVRLDTQQHLAKRLAQVVVAGTEEHR